MIAQIYRYQFSEEVVLEDAEGALLLALLATEFLHGETQVRLDAAHYFDLAHRTCVMDGSSGVGMSLNKLFIGFLSREFGSDGFQVTRINEWPQAVAFSDGTK